MIWNIAIKKEKQKMHKSFFRIILGSIVLALASCSTLEYQTNIDWDFEQVVISVNRLDYSGPPMLSIEGVYVTIENKHSRPITIDWDKSSIDINGAHRVFLSGQQYADAGKPIPSLTLAPGSKISTEISTADGYYYLTDEKTGRDSWYSKEYIGVERVMLLLYFTIDGQERYATVTIADIKAISTIKAK
jgi:hypothetical protein